jgi:hypothetical protein
MFLVSFIYTFQLVSITSALNLELQETALTIVQYANY